MNKKLRKRMRELDRKIDVPIGTHEVLFESAELIPLGIRNAIISTVKDHQKETQNA